VKIISKLQWTKVFKKKGDKELKAVHKNPWFKKDLAAYY
jgi:hypothetical protein